MFPLLLIFVIFYMLIIRPQQQRVKEHQAAISAIKKGDEVVTAGGIRGRVTKVSDDEAEVEIAQGVRVRIVKGTLSQVLDAKMPSQRTTDARFLPLEDLVDLADPPGRHPSCESQA